MIKKESKFKSWKNPKRVKKIILKSKRNFVYLSNEFIDNI